MNLSDSMAGKRKRSPEKERREVHKRIKSFFAQFKKGSNFDKIRTEIKNKTFREVHGFESMRMTSKESLDLSSAQKVGKIINNSDFNNSFLGAISWRMQKDNGEFWITSKQTQLG